MTDYRIKWWGKTYQLFAAWAFGMWAAETSLKVLALLFLVIRTTIIIRYHSIRHLLPSWVHSQSWDGISKLGALRKVFVVQRENKGQITGCYTTSRSSGCSNTHVPLFYPMWCSSSYRHVHLLITCHVPDMVHVHLSYTVFHSVVLIHVWGKLWNFLLSNVEKEP